MKGSYSRRLFVTSGMIENQKHYIVILKKTIQKGDLLRLYDKLNASTTNIVEFEPGTDQPHLEVKWRIVKKDGAEIGYEIECPIYIRPYYDFEDFSETWGEILDIVIYVPKGTVDNSFSVDINNLK